MSLVGEGYNLGLNSGYALPEAGGNGVNSFRYWGLAFLSVGALLLLLKKRPLR
ncbi:MAG: LPXTG cell wall anchor domain-containing protein [Clostridiales bacterium]|nr:LPXTG cell wall anchor domain-containing protein [Clostridiales bacterium]